tara:strand:+ start:250 stop:498 length:249 start_codon:yes stop_codon:yes gene_type:complete
MTNSIEAGKKKAIHWLTNFSTVRGCSEILVYKMFRKYIKNENEAIKAAQEFIETQCEVKTTTKKLFKKSAFLNNSYSNLLGE